MDQPKVKERDWITIGKEKFINRIDAYVISIHNDGSLAVGYYQNKLKAIKTNVIWDGEHWQFQSKDIDGVYLRGAEEHIVKQGPPR